MYKKILRWFYTLFTTKSYRDEKHELKQLEARLFAPGVLIYEPDLKYECNYSRCFCKSLEKVGNSFIGKCPFHKENSPSFVVKPTSDYYYCLSCGKCGSLSDLFDELRKLAQNEED